MDVRSWIDLRKRRNFSAKATNGTSAYDFTMSLQCLDSVYKVLSCALAKMSDLVFSKYQKNGLDSWPRFIGLVIMAWTYFNTY